MSKLSLSALAAAVALTFAGAAAAKDQTAAQPMTDTTATQTTAPTETQGQTDSTLPKNHGQAVSGVAQSDDLTTDNRGEAVSTMAHSNRDFKKLDADSDGFLSATELNSDPDLTNSFNDWDDDADTKLSQSEYDAYISSTVTDASEPEEEAE